MGAIAPNVQQIDSSLAFATLSLLMKKKTRCLLLLLMYYEIALGLASDRNRLNSEKPFKVYTCRPKRVIESIQS